MKKKVVEHKEKMHEKLESKMKEAKEHKKPKKKK
jgi:hypothetical protein